MGNIILSRKEPWFDFLITNDIRKILFGLIPLSPSVIDLRQRI